MRYSRGRRRYGRKGRRRRGYQKKFYTVPRGGIRL